MVIVLSLFFLLVWLVFFKFHWLPWNRPWKITVWSLALTIALVVVGALQYYTPTSKQAVVEAHTQFIYPLVSGQFALDERQAQYDQARAQLENARYNLANTLVTAPADGFITINALRAGQRINSKTAALTFLESDDVWIAAVVKQNGLAGIAVGKKASVTFSAAPGEIFQSEVRGELPGLVQGQLTIEAAASPVQAITAAKNAYAVCIAFPAAAGNKLRRPAAWPRSPYLPTRATPSTYWPGFYSGHPPGWISWSEGVS